MGLTCEGCKHRDGDYCVKNPPTVYQDERDIISAFPKVHLHHVHNAAGVRREAWCEACSEFKQREEEK